MKNKPVLDAAWKTAAMRNLRHERNQSGAGFLCSEAEPAAAWRK
jgi:hypothetical protein